MQVSNPRPRRREVLGPFEAPLIVGRLSLGQALRLLAFRGRARQLRRRQPRVDHS